MININVSNSYLCFTRHLALKLSALLALAVTVPSHAQTATWNGGAGAGDTSWGNATNWVGGVAPVANGNLTFAGNNSTMSVNNFPAGTQFNKIELTNNGNPPNRLGIFSLSGSSITLAGAITATTSTATIQDTIANDLIVNAAGASVNANGNHTVRLTGNLTLAGSTSYVFVVNSASAFSGAGGTIIFQGSGNNTTPTLSYSGSVPGTISRAITISGTGNGLGNIRATQANSQFIYNGVFTGRATQFSMDGSNTNVTSEWQSDFGNGNNTATNVQKAGTGNWLISGAIKTGAGTLTVAGTGSLTLTNASNNFTGAVSVNNGQLNFTSIGNQTEASALGAGGLITLGSNSTTATLNYIGSTNMTSNRTVRLGSDVGAAGNVYTGVISNNGTGTLVWTSSVFMPIQTSYYGTRSLVLSGTNAGDNAIQGTILDQTDVTAITNLTKNGAGKWILSGNNTYTGNTTVTAGTLQVGAGSDSGSIASSANIVNNGALVYNVGSGNRTYGNVISGSGSLNLNSSGGSLTLTGNNTYTGNTTVTAGTLGLTGNSASPVSLAAGTVLQLALASPVTSTSTLTFAGNATVSIVGTPVAATTYNLFTGSAITGTPALSAPIAGFTLSNNGTVLQLVPSGDGGDTTAPDAPTVALLSGSDTGSSNSDRITNATTPTFRITLNGTGATAPVVGDVVNLFNGATQVGTATLVLGDITATYVDVTTSVLSPGSLSFTATVTDTAVVPNVSAASAALSVTLDTTAPVIATAAPVSIDWGSSYSDVTPIATDETAPANPTVAASGSVNIAKPGAYILSYNATDAAGNPATTVTRTVTVAIANPTAVDASGYTPLLRYALGANGPGDTVAAPVTSATTTELSLTAVVRTDDPKLTVVGTTKTDLTSGTWTTTGVSGSPAGSGTLGDQTGVTAGQRRVYTVTTATKTFLRLEATLAP